MKHSLRNAFFSAAFLVLPCALLPSFSHASTGIDPSIEQALRQDYLKMARDSMQEKEGLTQQIGNIDQVNPAQKRQDMVKDWQQKNTIPNQPVQLSNMFGGNMMSSISGMMSKIGSSSGGGGGFGSGGLGMITSSMGGMQKSDNTVQPDGSCKVASANTNADKPAQKTTILASPIAATLLAMPIQAAGGAGVCQNGLVTCKDEHYGDKRQDAQTQQALTKSPLNDDDKCSGDSFKCSQ